VDPLTPPPTSTPPPGAKPLYGGSVGVPPKPPPKRDRGVRRALGIGALAVGLAMAAPLGLALRDGSPGGTPLSPIAEAAERTSNLDGAHFSGTGSSTAAGFEMTMSFGGVYDAEGRSRMRMEVQSVAAPQAAAMMNPLVAVQDGLTMYMSSPAFAAGLPDGASWMKLDMSEFLGEGEAPAAVNSMDARAVLGQLEMVSNDARTVDTERVRGAVTTHYAATIDPELQAEQLRDAGQELGAELIENQGGAASVEVWVDRDGLVRRTAMTIPFELLGGPGAQMSMTMDFFGFGATPEIEVPPEEATFDATELGRQVLEEALG
jgi:hypothetical protein